MNLSASNSPLGVHLLQDVETTPFPEHDALLLEWRRAAQAALPRRAAFSPAKLAVYATGITIYDLLPATPDAPRDYRYRFVGSDLTALFGEITGRRVSEFLGHAGWAERTMQACDLVVSCRTPVYGRAESIAHDTKGFFRNDGLMLPLSDDGTTVSAILIHYRLSYRDLD